MIFILLLTSILGFAQERTKLELQLDEYRTIYVIPGMAAAIYKDGELVEHAVSGIRKVGSEALISREDKFHLGSCTKSMTTTVAATLVEEGKLSWDAKVREPLPSLELHADYQELTFEMLLAHRSGLIRDQEQEQYKLWGKLPVAEGRKAHAEFLLKLPVKTTQGQYNYSNAGYIIAGYILEVISGQSWETLMQERLFDRLEMKSCGFGPVSIPGEEIPSQPWGHALDNWSIKPFHKDNSAYYGPAGTVHCSLPDWGRYLNLHLQGFKGQSDFLRPETFKKLYTVAPDSTYTWGGWGREGSEWGEVLKHTGSNTVNYANVWIAPDKNVIIMSVANRSSASAGWATADTIASIRRMFLKPKQ